MHNLSQLPSTEAISFVIYNYRNYNIMIMNAQLKLKRTSGGFCHEPTATATTSVSVASFNNNENVNLLTADMCVAMAWLGGNGFLLVVAVVHCQRRFSLSLSLFVVLVVQTNEDSRTECVQESLICFAK